MTSYGAVTSSNSLAGRENSTMSSSNNNNNNNTTTTTNSAANNNAKTQSQKTDITTDSNNNNNNANTFHSDTATAQELLMAEGDASRAVRFVKWYIGTLFYLRYPILLTWVVVILACGLGAGDLTKNLKGEVAPPSDSAAAIALSNFNKYFPKNLNQTSFLMFFDTTRIKSFDLTNSSEFYALDCYLEYWSKTRDLDAITMGVNTTKLLANISPFSQTGTVYSTWRVLESQNFWPPAIRDYLGTGNYSMAGALALTDSAADSKETAKFYEDFQSTVGELIARANLTGQVEVSLIGLPSFLQEINSASGRDIVVMFCVVVPIALLIFCWSLDSLRLGILALCSLISTLLLTFAALSSVATRTTVTTIAPGVVGALCISLSSDFTYMLVSKFRREVVLESAHFLDDPSGVSRGIIFVDPKHVMVMVLACAGRVVFLTAISVAFASMGLIFFPLSTISSIGIGCMLTAIMSILVSLILTPTLLVTFYRFFASGAEACEWPNFGEKKQERHHHHHHHHHQGAISGLSSKSLSTQPIFEEQQEAHTDPLISSSATENNNNVAISKTGGDNKNNTNNKNEKQPLVASGGNKPPLASPPSFAGSFAQQNNNNNNNIASHRAVVTNADGSEIPIAIPPSLADSSSQLANSHTSSGNPMHHHNNNSNMMESAAALNRVLRSANRANGTGTGMQRDIPLVSLSPEAVSRIQVQLRDKRVFYRDFTAFLCQPRVAICSILIVLGLCLYPMTRALDGVYSNAIDQFVPRDSKLLPAWASMRRNFVFADVFAYNVIIRFNKLKGYLPTIGKYPIGQDIAARMLQVPNTNPRGLEASFYDPHLIDVPWNTSREGKKDFPAGVNVSASTAFTCIAQASPCLEVPPREPQCSDATPYCKYRAIIFSIRTAIDSDEPVVTIYVQNTFLPTSSEGIKWLENMRAKLSEIEASYNGDVSIYIQGFGADSYDLVNYANDHLVEIVAILVACAWFIVTVFFFSLGASLRLLLSFVFTFFTTFGLATIIFVDGALSSWPVPAGLSGAEKAQAWLVPFMAIALNIATVLNYDVTTTMRVQQFRHQGIATRSAIVIAAIESSNEVFVAASMTMVSFVGLLFSQVPVMNQLGFYLIVGAFLQGIFFRLFLVAPVMSLLGELNWFPYMQCAQKMEGIPISFDGPTSQGPLEPGNPYRESLGVGNSNSNGNTNNSNLDGTGNNNNANDMHYPRGSRLTNASRNASFFSPPGATSTIVDNEALIWAARESGLDPRRLSTMSGANNYGNTNNNNNLRESYNYNYGSRAQSQLANNNNSMSQPRRGQSNFASTASNRPPIDFIFTANGAVAKRGEGNNNNNNNNTDSSSSDNYTAPNNTSFTAGGTGGGKLMRSSLAPGESSPTE